MKGVLKFAENILTFNMIRILELTNNFITLFIVGYRKNYNFNRHVKQILRRRLRIPSIIIINK